MAEGFKTVYQGGQGEIEEKRSRFIAYVEPVNSEEEASAFIEKIKKLNWNASHNCSAAVVGANNEFTRCSDDGEPVGTAGKPMLEVLLGEGVHNAAVVVTRYFGGTLLGTGGLVRAYQRAVKEGLKQSKIVEKYKGNRVRIVTDYNSIGKLQHIAASMNIYIMDTAYSDIVELYAIVREDEKKAFLDKVTEGTGGKAEIIVGDAVCYGVADGSLII